jgi:hypothetical protein
MLTHTASIQYAQVKISQPGVKIGQLKLSVTPVKGKNKMLRSKINKHTLIFFPSQQQKIYTMFL